VPEIIGLFPLQSPLLPGEPLPLHIFEPRYRLLLQQVLAGQQRIGINLLLDGQLHEIGCIAQVERILRRYRDGRMDIAVIGGQRYRIWQLDEQSHPYWVATVEWWTDEPEEPDGQLQQACYYLYGELLQLLRRPSAEVEELLAEARRTTALSFFLGKQLGLEPLQRQYLLQMRSERQRLHWIHDYLQGLLTQWRAMEVYIQRVRSNGYFPP